MNANAKRWEHDFDEEDRTRTRKPREETELGELIEQDIDCEDEGSHFEDDEDDD